MPSVVSQEGCSDPGAPGVQGSSSQSCPAVSLWEKKRKPPKSKVMEIQSPVYLEPLGCWLPIASRQSSCCRMQVTRPAFPRFLSAAPACLPPIPTPVDCSSIIQLPGEPPLHHSVGHGCSFAHAQSFHPEHPSYTAPVSPFTASPTPSFNTVQCHLLQKEQPT